jgi:hypothetical protein
VGVNVGVSVGVGVAVGVGVIVGAGVTVGVGLGKIVARILFVLVEINTPRLREKIINAEIIKII